MSSLSARDAILALLVCPDQLQGNAYNWGAPIEGKTRLVKELFLLSRETKPGRAGLFGFAFTPGPYGPSSIAVTNTLEVLSNEGRVSLVPYGLEAKLVSLAPVGKEEAQAVWSTLSDDARAAFFHIKSHYRDLGYRALMVYVYRTYPEFTVNSLIKDKILGA